ncbi:predicted protein [Lichtheimia corymbifera JMRC:FSU:9682]|uniref:Uncharacterized protein n=1 Tax=Lichtheimia corymbifera JMRC:FSU:9682 TaxID=1263082 RepID=A0A068SHC7_9FUNG|nr:predicted protein [Lichtheimia corymbifera JMRC:FSU:9682]
MVIRLVLLKVLHDNTSSNHIHCTESCQHTACMDASFIGHSSRHEWLMDPSSMCAVPFGERTMLKMAWTWDMYFSSDQDRQHTFIGSGYYGDWLQAKSKS